MPANMALHYGQQQIKTASPASMVYMLYEKLITCLREAIRAIENNDIAARCNANCRAMEILSHLTDTLDMEQGAEISQNLERIYMFSLRHLLDVDMRNDPKPAEDVIKLMQPLADSWRQLSERGAAELAGEMEKARKKPAAPAPSAAPTETSDQAPTSPDQPTPPTGGISFSA